MICGLHSTITLLKQMKEKPTAMTMPVGWNLTCSWIRLEWVFHKLTWTTRMQETVDGDVDSIRLRVECSRPQVVKGVWGIVMVGKSTQEPKETVGVDGDPIPLHGEGS